jgi:hypothetical protein
VYYSSGKSLTAIMLAMAVDRELLDYGDKICKYWPEFAQHNKQEVRPPSNHFGQLKRTKKIWFGCLVCAHCTNLYHARIMRWK